MRRRDFLRKSILIGAGFSWFPTYQTLFPELGASPARSRVVQINDPQVRKGHSFDEKRIEAMLDRGLSLLYDQEPVEKIWANLFSKKDVVGIKVNCLSGEHGSTHPILVNAIIEKLRRIGIPAGNIIIWDRLNEDLESAGYPINWKNRHKVLSFGNDAVGFDNKLYINGSVGSLITRTVTQLCTAIINVPVLKDHGIVGVTLAMKNFFGAIHNPNKYHDNNGDPYVADLYQLRVIRQKVRLTICDALDAQYEGGPPFKPQWNWPLNALLFSLDAVALDRVGWEIIERKRKEKGFPSLKEAGREPRYILTAGRKGIGESDLSKIEWIRS